MSGRKAAIRSRRRGLRLFAVAAALGVVLAAAAVVRGEVFEAGNVALTADANVSPKKLPRHGWAPVKLMLKAKIATQDGSPAPGLVRALVDFDVQGRVYTRGLDRCPRRKLKAAGPALARKRCRRAQIGAGSVIVATSHGSEPDTQAKLPLLLFNGRPDRGKPTVLMHAALPTSPPEVVVVRVEIRKAPGSVFGERAAFRVPQINGGDSRLVGVQARVGRRWHHRGKRRSFLLGQCFAGNFVFRGDLRFSDRTRANGSLIRGCRAR